MFTVSKLFWLCLILILVWNIFRIIEKRKGLRDKNFRDFDTTGKKADVENETIAVVYCSVCATFTAGDGCGRADCGIVG